MKRLFFIFVLILFTLSGNVSAKTRLIMNQGTMQAGGQISMPITIAKGSTSLGLVFNPEFHYFVARSLSLGITPGVKATDLINFSDFWVLSAEISLRYYFNLGGTIYPYIGGGFGFSWDTYTKDFLIPLKMPFGMLIALNSHVALDFGIPLSFTFNKEGFSHVEIPVGYFGVKAFF